MRHHHHKTLKWHTVFTTLLSIAAVVLIFVLPNAALVIGVGFLVAYILGNGLIHYKKGTAHRDTYIEYAVLAAVAIVLLLGFLFSY